MLGKRVQRDSLILKSFMCKPTSRSCSLLWFLGRFSDLFHLELRLPIDCGQQWLAECSRFAETYSSGYCTGFSPVSLSRFSL